MTKLNQNGVIHIFPVLLVVFTIGVISFLLLSSIAPFKGGIFNNLFPKPNSNAATASDTTYAMKVLVLKYFPLTPDGQNIDVAVTGDVGGSYTSIRQLTTNVTNNLLADLPKATTYLGYKDSNAQPSLTYQVVDTKEFNQAVPLGPKLEHPRYPDYKGIMAANNICNYVDNQGVSEVWMWAYQGPPKLDGHASLEIEESKMSGPFGDISNSPIHYNDMPLCQHTYRVYTFNYGRGSAEAIHTWGHQIENEMMAVDRNMFETRWQGMGYPLPAGQVSQCGNVHNPPNSSHVYDYNNPTPRDSYCLDWTPNGTGQVSAISCQNWGCQDVDDSNNSQLNFMVWEWQNLPGRNNSKTYQGVPLRNWWDVHGNFDQVMGSDRTLLLSANATPPPVYPAVSISDNFDRADNQSTLGMVAGGQVWNAVKGVFGINGNAAYSAAGCPAPGYAVLETGSPNGTLQVTLAVNHQDARIPFRYVDLNNMYWVEVNGNGYQIDQYIDGVRSTIATTSGVTPANGDVVKIELSSGSVHVSINGTMKMVSPDNSLTGTKHGIGTWCDTSMRFDNFSFNYVPPTIAPTPVPFGLEVTPSSVETTILAGTSVPVLTMTSTGSNQFAFFGYPTNFGPGINWSVSSGGIGVGQSYPVSIQVNSNIAPGLYTGTGDLRNAANQSLTFPVIVRVPAPPTPTPVPTLTPTPTPVPTPLPTSAPITAILGNNTIGGSTDTADSNYINGSQFSMGGFNGVVSSMSVYVAKINAAPNNKYQLAIYRDNNGKPGTLVASSQTGTLVANSWNTLPLSAQLSANTKYWLVYNTNGTAAAFNNMKFSKNGVAGWSTNPRAFGNWPQSFGSVTPSTAKFSIYATYTR